MPVYKISPIDRENADWRCSSYCGDVLVRAKTEGRARALAARAFGLFDPIGEGSCLCPWTSDLHTKCVVQKDPEEEDGPSEVLHPQTANRHALS